MRLTIFAPSLFAELADLSVESVDSRKWPWLAKLIARARTHRLSGHSSENNLLDLCGFDNRKNAAPIAALTSLIDFERCDDTDLMRIDPVYLRADPNQILLFNAPSITPSAVEADSLLEAINLALPELSIYRGRHPARWYINSNFAHGATTYSPFAANGRSIADFQPQGTAAQNLARVVNEIQMLFHDATVNLEREREGRPPINSVWPWGAGAIRESKDDVPTLLVGNDCVLVGVARHTNTDWQSQLDIAQFVQQGAAPKAHVLCVFGSPHGAATGDEAPTSLDEFDQQWAKPIVGLLRQFKLQSVRLVTDRESHRLTPRDIYCVWRRPTSNSGSLSD